MLELNSERSTARVETKARFGLLPVSNLAAFASRRIVAVKVIEKQEGVWSVW
jgi:hypothetical protein